MKKEMFLSCLFVTLLTISFAHAEISVSAVEDFYNLGDMVTINASIYETNDVYGLVQFKLLCPNGETIFYADYISVNAEQEKRINKNLVLDDGIGICHVLIKFEGDEGKTNNFIVSDVIKIEINVNKQEILPGEILEIAGKAVKENGKAVEGFADISIQDVLQETVSIKEGKFYLKTKISDNAKSGDNILSIRAYEKYNEKETNKGYNEGKIHIKAVPTKIEVAIDKESVIPDSTLTIKPTLYDQYGSIINEKVEITIKNFAGRIVFSKVENSDKSFEFFLPSNAPFGEWQIEIYASGLHAERTFNVEKFEGISIKIDNNTIIVKNIGNVLYKKSLEIRFKSSNGEFSETKEISLDLDEEKQFLLKAPDGIYSISVGNETFTSVPLTGKVAAAIEQSKPGVLARYPITAFVIFVVLVIFIIWLLSRPKAEVSKRYEDYTTFTENAIKLIEKREALRRADESKKSYVKEIAERIERQEQAKKGLQAQAVI